MGRLRQRRRKLRKTPTSEGMTIQKIESVSK
jgi:hypothetical protein